MGFYTLGFKLYDKNDDDHENGNWTYFYTGKDRSYKIPVYYWQYTTDISTSVYFDTYEDAFSFLQHLSEADYTLLSRHYSGEKQWIAILKVDYQSQPVHEYSRTMKGVPIK